MRETKFRGKRVDNDDWVYGSLVRGLEGDTVEVAWWIFEDTTVHISRLQQYQHVVDPATVGQFTGLRDNKRTEEHPEGQPIYEGDIVRCKKYIGGNFVDHCIESGYVEFVHGAFGLHRKQGFYRPFKDWLEDYELEVIGNIWENAEVLT